MVDIKKLKEYIEMFKQDSDRNTELLVESNTPIYMRVYMRETETETEAQAQIKNARKSLAQDTLILIKLNDLLERARKLESFKEKSKYIKTLPEDDEDRIAIEDGIKVQENELDRNFRQLKTEPFFKKTEAKYDALRSENAAGSSSPSPRK